MHSSHTEGSIYNLFFSGQTYEQFGVSTVHILETAIKNNISIYNINQDNLYNVLPLLDIPSEILQDIENAVIAGNKEVTIPQQVVNVNGWVGIGYIVKDLETGSSGYMINGGLAGGAVNPPADSTDPEILILLHTSREIFVELLQNIERISPKVIAVIKGASTVISGLLTMWETYEVSKDVKLCREDKIDYIFWFLISAVALIYLAKSNPILTVPQKVYPD